METRLSDFAKSLGLTSLSLLQFIQDFDLEIDECLDENQHIKPDFERLVKENIDFIQRYAQDLHTPKSNQEIAQTIQKNEDEVAAYFEQYQSFQVGAFTSNASRPQLSSYQIDKALGGDYQFIYNYFGKTQASHKKSFIGYKDVYFYILEQLAPFINPKVSQQWGIDPAKGILLYGPPGSGKIFWAKKIAQYIGYDFHEVPRSKYLGHDGIDFQNYTEALLQQKKQVCYLDDLHEIAVIDEDINPQHQQYKGVRNSLVNHLIKIKDQEVLILASTKNVEDLDEELVLPGRFEVMIPIFPPTPNERAEFLLYQMTKNLSPDGQLMQILKHNKAHMLPFWQAIAAGLRLFSNSMLVHFSQSLKKRLKHYYQQTESTKITIDEQLIKEATTEASTMLTVDYLVSVQQFVQEVYRRDFDRFAQRILALKQEIDFYIKKPEENHKIGFQTKEK
jgi:transitional endoplasmic reticulum ATPase